MLAISLVAVLISIIAGYLLKLHAVVPSDFGKKLLLVGFYVTVPALFLKNLTEVGLNSSSGLYLFILLLGTVLSWLAGWLITKIFKVKERKRIGSIVLASLIMNTGFVLPFAQSAFGGYGVALVALGNIVVATSTYSIGFIIAASYGNKTKAVKSVLLKPLTAPPFLAIILALIINIIDLDISGIYPLLDFIGQPTGFINALAVGSLIEIKRFKLNVFLPMIARYGVGLVFVVMLLNLASMPAIDKSILAAILLSPLAFNSVTLSAIEGLDADYNATALSVSLLIGAITVPLSFLLFA